MFITAIGLLAIATNLIHGHVTGTKDIPNEHIPYMVCIKQSGILLTTGTIISMRVVLSDSDQLIYHDPTIYSILYGTNDCSRDDSVITAQRILRNENDNDPISIALMFLVSDIPFSAVAQPISLASIAPAIGTYANISGWGLFIGYPEYLHQTSLQIMNKSICHEKYKNIVHFNENFVCGAIIGENNAYNYDSGSSLVRNGELVGVSSIGIGGDEDYYGVFTDITLYKDWIESVFNQ